MHYIEKRCYRREGTCPYAHSLSELRWRPDGFTSAKEDYPYPGQEPTELFVAYFNKEWAEGDVPEWARWFMCDWHDEMIYHLDRKPDNVTATAARYKPAAQLSGDPWEDGEVQPAEPLPEPMPESTPGSSTEPWTGAPAPNPAPMEPSRPSESPAFLWMDHVKVHNKIPAHQC